MIRTIATCALSALLLAGCMKTVDTACTAFQPIDYSASKDTEATVTAVRGHNAAWHAICD